MSLIDDALRRAQERRVAEATSGADPWTPAPLPDAGRARRRRIRYAAVLATAAAATVVAGLLLLRSPRAPSGPKSATPKEPGSWAAGAPAMPPTPTLPAAVAVAAPAPVPAPVRTEAAALASRGVAPVAAPPSPSAAASPRLPAPSGMPVVVRALPAASSSPRIAFSPEIASFPPPRPSHEHVSATHTPAQRRETARGEVTVPGGKIELGGIVYSETNPVAVLNGRIVGVGAVVEGFTVVGIEENHVELKNDGRTILLSLH